MAITDAEIWGARDAVLECIAVLDRARAKLFNTWGDWANSSSVSTPDPIPIIDEALKAISAHDVAARAQHIEMFQLLARANPECEVLDVIQGTATAATYTERAWKEIELWERQSQSTRAIVEAKEHPHFRALRTAIAAQIEYLNEWWRPDSSGTIRRIEVEAERAIAWHTRNGRKNSNPQKHASPAGNPGAETQAKRGIANREKLAKGIKWALENRFSDCMSRGKISAEAILRVLENNPHQVTGENSDVPLPLNGRKAAGFISKYLKSHTSKRSPRV